MSRLDSSTLARVFAFEPHLIEHWGETPPRDEVGKIHSDGGPVVTVGGRRLHSGRDPEREARRWARNLDLSETTLIVLMGYASGYAVRAIRSRTEAPIVVFEPDLDVLAEGLTHGDVPSGILIITAVERLGVYLTGILQSFDKGMLATWIPSLRANPTPYREAMATAAESITRARLRHQTATLRGPGWLRHFLGNLDHVAKTPTISQMRAGLSGVPAIIVAAGPSLDRNVHLLKELDDTALILCVNTAARALDRAGVRPHAMISIESADITSGISALPWLHEVPAFLELTAHPNMWAMPFRQTIPMAVDTSGTATFSQWMDTGLALSAGFCVANAAVAVAHALGCDPIVLIGSDLSYSGERVYASGTIFEEMRAVDRGDGTVTLEGTQARRAIEAASHDALSSNHAPDFANVLQLPAYGGQGTVVSTSDFKMFRDWYTFASERMSVELVNATEGGAHIPGWKHEPLRAIVDRHTLNARGDRAPVSRQLDGLLVRPPLDLDRLRDAIAREHDYVLELLGYCAEALAIVDFDPDGDLALDERSAARIQEINGTARRALRAAPLAAEACFSPIHQVRTRGELTTFAFYASIEGPLRELDRELARLLHNISSQHDAAHGTQSRSA